MPAPRITDVDAYMREKLADEHGRLHRPGTQAHCPKCQAEGVEPEAKQLAAVHGEVAKRGKSAPAKVEPAPVVAERVVKRAAGEAFTRQEDAKFKAGAVQWVDAVPPARGATAEAPAWCDTLRGRPGMWAIVETFATYKVAGKYAALLRRRPSMRGFEVVTRDVTVYARFVGTAD